jgi:phosphosulfolactate synthase
MLNFNLPYIPERPLKPREVGLTMVMDKGLSLQQAEALCCAAEYADLLKLGFGTGLLTAGVKEKIRLYQQAGLKPYFGGTLFEAFIARNMFDDYRRFITDCGVDTVEVSDGVLPIEHGRKCEYIRLLSCDFTVLSEVGTKLKGREITNSQWISWISEEKDAGAWKVIAEARESGNIGIYNADGSANTALILEIRQRINPDIILWEAPLKSQQVWFIKLLGANVNLGNVAPDELIALETLRLGLRGDTLLDFINLE